MGWSASVARHRELGRWGPEIMAARGCSPTAWQRARQQQDRKRHDSGSGAAHRLLQHFKHEVRSVAVAEHQHRLGLGCRPKVRLMHRAGREGGSGVSKSAGPLHPQLDTVENATRGTPLHPCASSSLSKVEQKTCSTRQPAALVHPCCASHGARHACPDRTLGPPAHRVVAQPH